MCTHILLGCALLLGLNTPQIEGMGRFARFARHVFTLNRLVTLSSVTCGCAAGELGVRLYNDYLEKKARKAVKNKDWEEVFKNLQHKDQKAFLSPESQRVFDWIRLNWDKKDEIDNTLLHKACANSDEHAVRVLLFLGADLDAKNNLRQTPLHYAIERNADINLIKLLVKKHKANIDAQDHEHRTPRSLAASKLDALGMTTSCEGFHNMVKIVSLFKRIPESPKQ
jgi:hypothetical protein